MTVEKAIESMIVNDQLSAKERDIREDSTDSMTSGNPSPSHSSLKAPEFGQKYLPYIVKRKALSGKAYLWGKREGCSVNDI